MKFTANQIMQGEDEVILNYKEMNDEVYMIKVYMINYNLLDTIKEWC